MTKEQLAADIDSVVQAGQPGQTLVFAQPIEMRFNELLEGVRADISGKVIGTDYDVMEPAASKIRDLLQSIPGTREGEGEVEFETQGRAPVLVIRARKEVLQKYNLSAESVNQVVRSALGGGAADGQGAGGDIVLEAERTG